MRLRVRQPRQSGTEPKIHSFSHGIFRSISCLTRYLVSVKTLLNQSLQQHCSIINSLLLSLERELLEDC